MNTKDKIRAMVAKGITDNAVMARRARCHIRYVAQTRWYDARPGYLAKHMARKRKNDPRYRRREHQQQVEYQRLMRRKRRRK